MHNVLLHNNSLQYQFLRPLKGLYSIKTMLDSRKFVGLIINNNFLRQRKKQLLRNLRYSSFNQALLALHSSTLALVEEIRQGDFDIPIN